MFRTPSKVRKDQSAKPTRQPRAIP
jgi:hypothetical protein